MKNQQALRRLSAVVFVAGMVLAGSPDTATGQKGHPFLTIGGGGSFPTGANGAGMKTGWLTQAMGGYTLPGDVFSLQLGGSYGQSRLEAGSGGMMGGGMTVDGTSRMLGLMGGIMAMPPGGGRAVPYAVAGAGIMRASTEGASATSFAWSAGAGITFWYTPVGIYVEARFLQARKGGATGNIIPITVGIKLGG